MNEYQPPKRGLFRLRGHSVEMFGRTLRLPANRLARMALGIAFLIGGVFSFLPILGLWMLPLGLIILSIDLAFVRRWRRRTEVKWGRRQRLKFANNPQAAGRPWYRWVRLPNFGRR
ncbi:MULTISPECIES: hypothetical protein [unclassified Aureimonas]|uniref:hypothetical protein n=1 Tax=unclassified Aureimonas TaxID=2615206 RepID=UPI0007209718|nr:MULTISPECIES: hypothetical protein [unclassified Aureimonas]ALN73442.1 hypothetical protein M673_12010 [Aureimonas sp. AU20]